MEKHKWATEIKMWADGAQIEYRLRNYPPDKWTEWKLCEYPTWVGNEDVQYRVYDPYRELRKAFAAGKQIQHKIPAHPNWIDTYSPIWDANTEYRIKPESEYKPFEFTGGKGSSILGRKIKHKETGELYSIIYEGKNVVGVWGRTISYKELLEDFVFFSSNEPCGVKV